jgi:membrane-bound lytic murein transglycosylase D
MKKKKVISYALLLFPLALPAACSPLKANSSHYPNSHQLDDPEQLRSLVERYFEQEQQKVPPSSAASQQSTSLLWIEVDEDELLAEEVGHDLEEELAGLQETGEWTAEGAPVLCVLPITALATEEQAADVQPPAVVVVEKAEQAEEKAVAVAVLKSASKAAQEAETACDFPVIVNKQVEYYLSLFQNRQRNNFKRWMERSSRYLPFITKELREAGLPEELAYLAMIESGFNPSAYSRSHASGLWQFIPGTAAHYGLQIDAWRDERRDPEKATKAAIAYLKALYKRFGDWPLAVAAYNAGEGTVERGLKKHNAKDFWELASHDHLYMETKRYVPQLMAAILIARNPAQYGFTDIQPKKPVPYDLIQVPPGTRLDVLAVNAALNLKDLRGLNNELLKDQVPMDKKGYTLRVPAGTHHRVAANLEKAQPITVAKSSGAYASHTVAKNETLSHISKQYNVSMTNLLKANSLRSSTIQVGQRLRIPLPASAAPQYAAATGARNAKMVHTVRNGETLSAISSRYSVPMHQIMQWNGLAHAGRIQVGQALNLYTKPQEAAAAPTTILAESKKHQPKTPTPSLAAAAPETGKAADKIVTLVGSKKQQVSAAQTQAPAQEASVSYYQVRSGDSLWSIARKLQVSTGELKNWNSLDNALLHPGTTLIIRNS